VKSFMKTVFFAVVLVASGVAQADFKMKGAEVPESVEVDGTKLVCHGMGVRTYMLLAKVYVGALYTEKSPLKAEEIRDLTSPKRIFLNFLMSVPKDKITAAWRTGILDNCKWAGSCDEAKEVISPLNSLMKDMGPGKTLAFDTRPGEVDVLLGGEKVGSVKSANADKYITAVFLGPKPPNESLKTGLLASCQSE